MEMKVIQIGQPVLGQARSVQAVSDNGIAIAFAEPRNHSFQLGESLEVDLETIDSEQQARNLTQGRTFPLTLRKNDVHDVRQPMAHGTPRFPSLLRRRGTSSTRS